MSFILTEDVLLTHVYILYLITVYVIFVFPFVERILVLLNAYMTDFKLMLICFLTDKILVVCVQSKVNFKCKMTAKYNVGIRKRKKPE